jgi:uroporphyrinogen III methyltransferase/synthase
MIPQTNMGIVYLVGAGPGDPKLITIRGAECLTRADVVVYDRLTNCHQLEYAPACAERIYAGKSPGRQSISQIAINRLLVERAYEGKTVVRLKGGDPFVLGRGGEEAEALAAAGVPFEIVPGVTSAVAVPAYAGIPLTHRDYASSFAVVTGHARKEAAPSLPPIPDADTLVVLMGVKNLAAIVERMLIQGRSPATPAAFIQWGTTPMQRTVVATLDTIVERAAGIGPPAVLVVGEVVALRERLRWFEDRFLFGLGSLTLSPTGVRRNGLHDQREQGVAQEPSPAQGNRIFSD